MKQIRLNGQQVQSLLGSGEVVVRKPVRPGRGQSWLRQPMIDEVKEVEFDGGDWLTLKHPTGEGNLTCIRNPFPVGEFRLHRATRTQIVGVEVAKEDGKWQWMITLRLPDRAGEGGA